MAVNYQVGDVVRPDFGGGINWPLALAVESTSTGIWFSFVLSSDRFFVVNAELHLLRKDETGTLLYGNKKEQHS